MTAVTAVTAVTTLFRGKNGRMQQTGDNNVAARRPSRTRSRSKSSRSRSLQKQSSKKKLLRAVLRDLLSHHHPTIPRAPIYPSIHPFIHPSISCIYPPHPTTNYLFLYAPTTKSNFTPLRDSLARGGGGTMRSEIKEHASIIATIGGRVSWGGGVPSPHTIKGRAARRMKDGRAYEVGGCQ